MPLTPATRLGSYELVAPLGAGGWADAALRKAVGLWFLVTLLGQWVFLYRVVRQYSLPTVSGQFEGWMRNNELFRGYVPGDIIGNLNFASHTLLAAVVTFGGLIQLIPQIRARAIAVHRWNGRAFLVSAAIASVTGLYMVWVRHATFGPVNSVGVSLNAVLNLVFGARAWRAARAGDIHNHRRWALRTFMVVSGVFFKRIATGPGWFFEFASYLIPLAVLELYLRAKDSRSTNVRFAMAIVLLGVVVYASFGTVRFARWVF
ncbi:MAG: DUF2306 domain-containing protein [Candidatus Eiseniibacteriota bacterium]